MLHKMGQKILWKMSSFKNAVQRLTSDMCGFRNADAGNCLLGYDTWTRTNVSINFVISSTSCKIRIVPNIESVSYSEMLVATLDYYSELYGLKSAGPRSRAI